VSCSGEDGVGSARHEQVLDLLNGRKLAFVGDSLTRYDSNTSAYTCRKRLVVCMRTVGLETL
jgi:hypothetical protein